VPGGTSGDFVIAHIPSAVGTSASVKQGHPPTRSEVCPHDRFRPERQSCHCCGIQDHFDFRVSDEIWTAVTPLPLATLPVCLRCFDAFAAQADVAYANALTRVDFVGDRGSFTFVPEVALDATEWSRG
jgi:hypothetical protein